MQFSLPEEVAYEVPTNIANSSSMIAKIVFSNKTLESISNDAVEEIIPLLVHIRNEGFIYGKEIYGSFHNEFAAFVNAYEEFQIQKVCETKHSKECLKRLKKLFGQRPKVFFGNNSNSNGIWRKPKSLLLFTHFLDEVSPIINPYTGCPVPMFKLPISSQTKQGLLYWQALYKAIDTLYMLGDNRIERFNYQQVADPISEFGLKTRSLASEVESETGIPTFSFFNRYYSLGNDEVKLSCPLCSRKWKSREKVGFTCQFIDRVCMKCKIVTPIGQCNEGKTKGKIGTGL